MQSTSLSAICQNQHSVFECKQSENNSPDVEQDFSMMSSFSSVFISDNFQPVVKIEPLVGHHNASHNARRQPGALRRRKKVGDIYKDNESLDDLTFVCFSCAAEYSLFTEFTLHVQSHIITIYTEQIKIEHVESVVDEDDANRSDDSDDDAYYNEADNLSDSFTKVEIVENTIDDSLPKASKKQQKQHEQTTITDHKCSHCNRYFKNQAALVSHEKSHTRGQTKTEQFECFDCHVQMDSLYKCKQHVQQHRSLPFECPYCFRRFKSNKSHRAVCGPWNTIPCPSCPIKFHNTSALDRHSVMHKKSTKFIEYIPDVKKLAERQYICRGCPYRAEDLMTIGVHVEQCIEVKTHCTICKKLVMRRMMEEHMQLHDIRTASMESSLEESIVKPASVVANNDINAADSDWSGHWSEPAVQPPVETSVSTEQSTIVRQFKCQYCQKRLGNMSSLVRHERVHTRGLLMPRSFECFICREPADNRYRCVEHMRTHDILPYQCKFCHVNFNERRFRTHQRVCGPANQFACPSCHMCFHNAGALTRHRKVHRERRYISTIADSARPSELQFTCKSCPYVTDNRRQIAQHGRVCIGQALPCPVCGKLVRRKRMRYHLLTHSDARSQLCLQCGKCYKNTYQLNIHMRTHSDERNFQCDLCSSRFKSANEMGTHRKRHFNRITYFCSICSKPHKSSYLLGVHLKSKHTMDVDPKDTEAVAQNCYTKIGDLQ